MADLAGPHRGDEGSQGAHHDVHGAVGREQVGDEAAHKEPRRRGREQEGQDAQGLREPELDGSVGQAEDVAEVAQHGVQGGHHSRQGEIADRTFAHEKEPPFFV